MGVYRFDEFELDEQARRLVDPGGPLSPGGQALRLLELPVRRSPDLVSLDEAPKLDSHDGRSIDSEPCVADPDGCPRHHHGERVADLVGTPAAGSDDEDADPEPA